MHISRKSCARWTVRLCCEVSILRRGFFKMLNSLETWLAGVYKGTPKLSSGAKKSIVSIWPWVALVLGVLQVIAAYGLWRWGHDVNKAVDTLNTYLGTSLGVHHLNVFYWLSLIVLAVNAVILLMAFPKLKVHAKAGWNLIFYSALLNGLYGVFSAFNDYGGGGSLIMQIIVSAVVLYFLFQIRDQYGDAKT